MNLTLETSIKRMFASQVDPYITNATMSGGQTRSRHDLGHPYGRVGPNKKLDWSHHGRLNRQRVC